MIRRILVIATLAASLAAPAWAVQSLRAREDSTVNFKVSLTGITRVSLKGDRIRRLVNNGSNFEMSNDEETGDIFIRFVGDNFQTETGFLISESGATINYRLSSSRADSETVVIDLVPNKSKADEEAVGGGMMVDAGAGSGGNVAVGYEAGLAAFMQKAWATKIGRRAPRGSGHVDSYSSGGYRARILVVRAGANGATVSAQSYYRGNVVAVLVERARLAAGQSSWVMVVEQK